jgi:hypothetical protein
VRRTGRGESFGAVIHICMGTSQGNSLCSYLYLKLAKHHVSCFIYYVFSSIKPENRRVKEVLPGEGVGGGKRGKRMTMVQTMYTQVCKCKMIPVETIPGIRGGQMGERSGGNSNIIYMLYIVRDVGSGAYGDCAFSIQFCCNQKYFNYRVHQFKMNK